MKRLLGLTFLIALFSAGCSPQDREEISDEGGQALEHAGRAISTTWESVSDKVREITPDSTEEAMDQARTAAKNLQNEVSKIPDPSPELKLQAERARLALVKIDAATEIRVLRMREAVLANPQNEADEKELAEVQALIVDARKHYDAADAELKRLSKD